jgi:hypothetical protein
MMGTIGIFVYSLIWLAIDIFQVVMPLADMIGGNSELMLIFEINAFGERHVFYVIECLNRVGQATSVAHEPEAYTRWLIRLKATNKLSRIPHNAIGAIVTSELLQNSPTVFGCKETFDITGGKLRHAVDSVTIVDSHDAASLPLERVITALLVFRVGKCSDSLHVDVAIIEEALCILSFTEELNEGMNTPIIKTMLNVSYVVSFIGHYSSDVLSSSSYPHRTCRANISPMSFMIASCFLRP